jgi:hypothetical protein
MQHHSLTCAEQSSKWHLYFEVVEVSKECGTKYACKFSKMYTEVELAIVKGAK